MKGQKRGDLTVSNASRERKWPDLSVKEYQRKDKAQIQSKSISEATKCIRPTIPKRVNIKGPQAKSKKEVKPFKALRSQLMHIKSTQEQGIKAQSTIMAK